MELGERLYQLRRERRMSQEALADALGVSRQSVSKWENGASTPDLDKLVRLGELFGLSLGRAGEGAGPAHRRGDGGGRPPPLLQGTHDRGRCAAGVRRAGRPSPVRYHPALFRSVAVTGGGALPAGAGAPWNSPGGHSVAVRAPLFRDWYRSFSLGYLFPRSLPVLPALYLLLDWLAFLPFLLLLGLAVRAAWGRFDRSSLMRLGLAAALFFAARVVCGLLNHSLLASSLLELDFGFYFPWPYQLSKTALLLALFPLPFGGYRRRPFVVLAGWVLSFGLDRLAAAAFPYSTFLYYYWPLCFCCSTWLWAWAGGGLGAEAPAAGIKQAPSRPGRRLLVISFGRRAAGPERRPPRQGAPSPGLRPPGAGRPESPEAPSDPSGQRVR